MRQQNVVSRQAKVLNQLGLHARPAAEFVKCAQKFESTIYVRKLGESYSAVSILDILSANLDCGSEIEIEAEGPDAEIAVEKLFNLLRLIKEDEEGV